MRIDPAIASMQRDRSVQRRAQTAMIAAGNAWRSRPEVAPLLADLARYGGGAPLADCPTLANAFKAGGTARELAASTAEFFVTELARNCFGQVPFRHGSDGRVSTLLLARSERAHIVLHAREPGEWTHPSVGFCDAERHEVILAGAGEAALIRRAPQSGSFARQALVLHGGKALSLDLSCEALQVSRVSRRLLTLRLHRSAGRPGPSREYRFADGALVHQAAGDIRASRQEMMLALLGRMEHAPAAPTMAAIAREDGDTSLRWQALRECLALDTAEGFRALSALAQAANDSLAGPAGALRAQLVEAHPQLLALESHRCPA